MTNTDEPAAPVAESNETPPEGRRTVVVGLAIGLVLCLLLAVGVAFLARKQLGELTRERDAARGELQKATAENAARMERFVLAARLELAELAHLLVVARQDPNTGKDIGDPVLPGSIAGKRRAALSAAFELKQAKVPFRWGGRRKEDGVDSVGFVALALADAGMLLRPDVLTSKGLQNLLNVKTEGEPEPGDILFFDSGIVMLYLGGDNAVGMLPEGAVTKTGVIKGRGIGFKYMGHGTIRYD
ncbi:MAG TPA: NlpC/P60 family protein [Methylomirabilota bacterium]|nr:NlpC/P60 family protein [Methylomirabilota bacterium]